MIHNPPWLEEAPGITPSNISIYLILMRFRKWVFIFLGGARKPVVILLASVKTEHM